MTIVPVFVKRNNGLQQKIHVLDGDGFDEENKKPVPLEFQGERPSWGTFLVQAQGTTHAHRMASVRVGGVDPEHLASSLRNFLMADHVMGGAATSSVTKVRSGPAIATEKLAVSMGKSILTFDTI